MYVEVNVYVWVPAAQILKCIYNWPFISIEYCMHKEVFVRWNLNYALHMCETDLVATILFIFFLQWNAKLTEVCQMRLYRFCLVERKEISLIFFN